jgi:hypothetical protein
MAIPPGVRKEILNGDFAALAESVASLRAASLINDEQWSAILAHLRDWLGDALTLATAGSTVGAMVGGPVAANVHADALPAVCCAVARVAHKLGLTSTAIDAAIGIDEDAIEKVMAELDA